MAKFICAVCKKPRQIHPSAPKSSTCIRCKLVQNKVIALRAFHVLTDEPDMREFKASMEQWYV